MTPSWLWFYTRGTAVVALVLLTGAVLLGITGALRLSSRTWPRFVTQALHRNLSLLAVTFVGIHVATAIADSYAHLRWRDALIPFVSAYRPIWVGLGAIALDLVIALIITSLLRVRLGLRAWRGVHWLAYAAWPIAVVHGLGSGSDVRQPWMLGLTAGCVVAVLMAVWTRLASGWPSNARIRLGAGVLSVVVPIAVMGWLAVGPLAPGWSKRSGTSPTVQQSTGHQTSGAPTSEGDDGGG
jgi:predicted ferric reductase